MKLVLPLRNLGIADGVMVEDEHGRFVVTARVHLQRDRMVLRSLFIEPKKTWSDDGKGYTQTTPSGGITQHVLRSIPYARFGPFAETEIRRLDPTTKSGRLFLTLARLKLPAKSISARPRPRRESGRDDRFYAEVAAQYLKAHHEGSRSPVRDLAAARNVTYAKARDLVHETRVRGLLSPGTPGISGGRLTDRAIALLPVKEPS